MSALMEYNQYFPVGTNRPGSQLLEVTIRGNGTADDFATAVFQKPFRSVPRLISWIQTEGLLLAPIRLTRFSSLTETGFTAQFDDPIGNNVFTVLVLAPLKSS